MDQDDKKSFCLLRFEINWTSAAEDVDNFAMFPYTETAPPKKESGFQRI